MSLESYIMEHKFVRKTSRLKFWEKNTTQFINWEQQFDNYIGVNKEIERTQNETYDGINFSEITTVKLFTHHWYYSDRITNYEFIQDSYIDLLAHLGGLSKSLFFIFGLIGIAFNKRKVVGKNIRNLYFYNDSSNNQNNEDV